MDAQSALTPATSFSTDSFASPNSIAVFGSTKSGLSMPAKPGRHRALADDDLLRLVDVQDRHAVDRAPGLVARRRVDDVVRADHEHDVGLRELGVDLVHLLERGVGHVRLGEQHVHVARHAAGDRMDRERDLDPLRLEQRPRARARRAAPARPPSRSPGTITTFCAYESMIATSSALTERTVPSSAAPVPAPACTCPNAPKSTLPDRAVHRAPHHHRQQRSRGADERAAHDQDVRVELEAGRGRREARERVQQRDHDGHVGAADRQHEQHAEDERAEDQQHEHPLLLVAGDDRDPAGDDRRRAGARSRTAGRDT